MPRATVRAAIHDYLASANLPLVGMVFAHPPRWTGEEEFFLSAAAGVPEGVVVFIHLQHQDESRFALGGPTSGMKMRHYRCILICILKSKSNLAEDADAANDTFLDALVGTIEANRVAASAGTIFQWGEGDTIYAPDLHVYAGMPRMIRGQSMQIFNRVEVSVLEQLNT